MHDKPLGSKASFFSQEARRLIEIEAGVLQNVIQCLAKEEGLRCLRELLEKDFEQMPAAGKKKLLEDQILPFLETVAHPKVLSSLVLEQTVGTIYNFLYGIDGRRAAHFLNYTCDALSASDHDEATASRLEASLLVFSRIVDLNSRALVQEPLKHLAKRFDDLFITLNNGHLTNFLHVARVYLERLLRRLEIGKGLLTASTKLPNQLRKSSELSFVIPREPPGGRHNNDHQDFSKIRIMPSFQEITSSRTEYLPVLDPAQWHVGGIDGLLDRNFRLLREDAVGQLRDAVHHEIRGSRAEAPRKNQARTLVYHAASFGALRLEKPSGFQFLVFCTVAETQQSKQTGTKDKQIPKSKQQELSSLWINAQSASTVLALVDNKPSEMQAILNNIQRDRPRFSILEFPGVLLPAFESTLRALQTMKGRNIFPFADLLLPTGKDGLGQKDVTPPIYSLKPGFAFNLRCLMNDNTDFYVGCSGAVNIERLEENFSLDKTQAVALVNSLQRRVGLIQGPPGTGKSYTGVALIRVLLANKRHGKTDLGPIVCVTYTNHALDQLLEVLLDRSVTSKIIRIGSQSKSDRLRSVNINHIASGEEKTKLEKETQWSLLKQLEECKKDFAALEMNKHITSARIVTHLRNQHGHYYNQLFGRDDDGFQMANTNDPGALLDRWARSDFKRDDNIFANGERRDKIFELPKKERQELLRRWKEEILDDMMQRAIQITSSHTKAKSDFDNTRDEGYDPKRWKAIITLRGRLNQYYNQVKPQEQPFQRVRDMVENAKRRRGLTTEFVIDDGVLLSKGVILATALSIRLDIALFSDFFSIKENSRSSCGPITTEVDLGRLRREFKDLIDSAVVSNRPLQQVEGYVFLAQLRAFERSNSTTPDIAECHHQEGKNAILKAREVLAEHPGQTRGMMDEIDGAEKMLRGSTCYAAVTNEERMVIIKAMDTEFRGTGHWYYCRNGHPFTIGECGGAMETASCPECGAAVGGHNHRTVEGVTPASDLETTLRGSFRAMGL
ncbi:hypothetical protein P170DRAFT_479223 [Aspergillus steynii IBT 23096]|uniref:RZ-type domain-containing protein n=1 Tax=Aspergillus steynii IBT 23096 TaxID=1392250 RepID=A0A2I2G0B7_9EURO|nr:uncharacterized protein P170DRAFT_479223 [Aspergillus steynii IBT 23096]PLB46313.1 hypothetical protein P170DRAFT_479223 [Aspergillus steynii IBT 23096]